MERSYLGLFVMSLVPRQGNKIYAAKESHAPFGNKLASRQRMPPFIVSG
jgi:hypothetical protein